MANTMGVPSRRLLWKEAAGVVAAISPWNFPFQINMAKLCPALAAGCTVVLKSAPETPWTATIIAKVAVEQTDIPPGVLNVLTSSDPASVGERLTSDPRVDMVSFTGSTATGRRIMSSAAGTVKRVFLELGGKSANIILDDTPDFNTALLSGFAVCYHAGQGCALTTRMLLPRKRYQEGVEFLRHAFGQLPYGDPFGEGQIMGPLISARQRSRVLEYVEVGRRDGARLVCGGKQPERLPKGYYVEPTLFADVHNDMRIAQEEIFGPVLVAIPYDDDDDAVRIANESIYGLSGAVFGSTERALRVARRIRTGTLNVNGANFFAPDSPFGGYKQSGIGREMGEAGVRGIPAEQDGGGPRLIPNKHIRGASMNFAGKVVVITGAAQGIGEGYALGLAKLGCKTVVADINAEQGERVARKIKESGGDAMFVQVDVSSEASAKALAEKVKDRYGAIHYLVNNAALFGNLEFNPLLTVDLGYLNKVVSVNMLGARSSHDPGLWYAHGRRRSD